jgi:ubiquinone/menaquinone biosynthesis C-methylase UbiE
VDSVDPGAGFRVLDVGGGTGNAAIAAACCNCHVTCTDFVPALLDRGTCPLPAPGAKTHFWIAPSGARANVRPGE